MAVGPDVDVENLVFGGPVIRFAGGLSIWSGEALGQGQLLVAHVLEQLVQLGFEGHGFLLR